MIDMTTNTTATATVNDPVANLAKVCTHYGVKPTGNVQADLQALSQRPEFKAAYAKTNDIDMAIEEISIARTPNTMLDAWFLANDVLAWDENAKGAGKGAVVRKPGCRVLGADGRVYDVAGSPMPTGTPRMTTCQLGPATIKYDIVRGTRTAEFPSGRSLKLAQHTAELPALDFGHHVTKLNKVVGKSKLLPGDTGDFPVVASGRVGTAADAVEYYPPGKFDESLKVWVYDTRGGKLAVNLDPNQKATYGIRNGADKQEIWETLKGQPIVLMGKIGQTYGIEVEKLEHNGLKGQAVLDALVAFLDKQGCIQHGSNANGPTLNLSFESQTDGRTGVPVGSLTLVGLSRYNKPDGTPIWKLTAKSKAPSFRHKRSEYTVKDNDGNDNTKVSNPDGLCYLPNLQGKNTSRFVGLGKLVTLQQFEAPTATPANGMKF